MDSNLAALLTRHQTDGDVFSEIQATADCSMQVAPTMTACNGRRNPGRPLLASSVSLSDGLLYPSSADMSVEPRFNSDPTHLNEILSSLHIAQNMHPMVLTRPSTYQQQQQSSAGITSTGPDRRTLSLGDFSAFTASLQQHTMPGGHRKLSDAATLSWDGTTPIADSAQNPAPQRYKTELCRPYEENGTCRYGTKCQFAHGKAELRTIARHPKYKTEMCRTFHTTGYCPYGPRCHFIHNDEAVDQVPSSQHPQSLSRQSSTSSTVGGVVEHASSAATVARDSERRRVQLMHSQSRRSRTTIAETPNEIELASEWLAESEAIDQPQSSYATTASAQSSIWLTAAAAPLPASSSSSPISSTSTADQLVHYMVDPPPGLPIPAAVSNRSSPRSNGGISPTYDTMSMTGSGLGDTSASATPAMFSPLSLSTAGRRCSTGRPVLSAPFYADERVQLTSTTPRFQIGSDTPISVAVHHQNDRQPSPTGSVDSVWFSSNSNVSDRRAAFRSTSTWAGQSINHSFDDIGSNSSSVSVSSNDEDDAHDIRQTVASFSTDQWKLLVDLVKTYAPSDAFSPMSDNTTLAPSMPSTVDTWKISRSMSIADPSTMTSHPVDNLHWTSHRATTPANFASALASNRAAGVCG